jgi:RNA-directed DNA polymerase
MNLQKWDDVNWELVQKRVFRYQRRIYEASKRGDKNVVKALQIRLISSIDSKLLAIEQATNNLNDVSVNLNSEKKIKDSSKTKVY